MCWASLEGSWEPGRRAAGHAAETGGEPEGHGIPRSLEGAGEDGMGKEDQKEFGERKKERKKEEERKGKEGERRETLRIGPCVVWGAWLGVGEAGRGWKR